MQDPFSQKRPWGWAPGRAVFKLVTRICLGPAGKERGSTWKGGSLECGDPEFGGRALSEGVWGGFRPSALEGVSEYRDRALGGGVEVGLGLCTAEGGSEGRGLGLGAQQAPWCLNGQGKCWPWSFPFL